MARQEKSVSVRMPCWVFERPRHKTKQGNVPAQVKTLQDLIALIRVAVARFGCPLCGDRHELEFHSYPLRRSIGSDGERSRSHVVTIICRASQGTGRQYTKRILPEHLIPRSPFWSERLVQLLERGRDAYSGFIEAACEALGCVDPRTARKHIRC